MSRFIQSVNNATLVPVRMLCKPLSTMKADIRSKRSVTLSPIIIENFPAFFDLVVVITSLTEIKRRYSKCIKHSLSVNGKLIPMLFLGQ